MMELEDEFGTEIPDEENLKKSILLVMQLNTSIVLKNKNLHLSRLQDGSDFFLRIKQRINIWEVLM